MIYFLLLEIVMQFTHDATPWACYLQKSLLWLYFFKDLMLLVSMFICLSLALI